VRVVFLGTPVDAVLPLRALVDAGHDVALVVTQPDRRRSRGGGADPSPVKVAASELGLPVLTPNRAREVIDDVRSSGAELGVTVAFGQLLPPAFLEALPHGFVNMHFSLLPRWRGAAPVERAILAGDPETGVCLMRIEEGLDTGGIYACASTPIGADETAGELHARLVELGTDLMLENLPRLPATDPSPQQGEPIYAEKLSVDEFRIDPRRSAAELERLVRAGNPRPGAWMVVKGKRVKVLRAKAERGGGDPGAIFVLGAEMTTGDGFLFLEEVQVEGKRPMSGDAWLHGLAKRGTGIFEVELP
jgi:methionyl-tRNA formyltransferase